MPTKKDYLFAVVPGLKDMSNILARKAEEAMIKRAEWVDGTIAKALPKWKLKLLNKYPNPILAKLLFINIEIINQELVGNFGTQVRIKLNGKLIGKRNFV